MPTLRFQRRRTLNPRSAFLRDAARNVTSQHGEDGIIAKVFGIIGVGTRWCVEFGAWDGKHLSNTWNLVNRNGWSAVLIEGNSDRAARLAKSAPGNGARVQVVNAYVGWDGPSSLDQLLSETDCPTEFDLLSIDIDGNDWHVWRALQRYRPRIVVIEFNPTASNQLYYVQDPDPKVTQGSSLLAMIELGKEKGYELIATTDLNAFFVVQAEYSKLGIEDNSIDAMHQEIYTTELFQAYDGTLFANGNTKLLWHDIEFSSEDLQVLPKSLRKSPY